MGIPYGGGGDDGDGGSSFYRDEQVFSGLPDEWQADPYVQNMYSELMGTSSWSDAHDWHDYLQDYIADKYGVDFDNYFDWQDWRDNYKEHAA